jgi:ABC-2 type transport system permease protein
MIKKEVKQTVRDPKARPLIFAAPIAQMLLLGYAATTDVKDIKTLVVDHYRTAESRALVSAYQASSYFTIIGYSERAQDVTVALDRGTATVALTIPAGFARELRSGRGAVVQTLIDGADASLARVAQSYAGQVAADFGARSTGAMHSGGVDLRSRAWFNPSLESRFFNVPAIMGILMMMVCLILTALGVVREREIGTLDQLLVSPVTPTELMLGKTIPILGIGCIHLLVYLGLSIFHFGVPLQGSLFMILLAALLYLAAALSLGLLLSTVSRTQQEAFMLLILVLFPTVLLSGFLSPVESMPDVFQWIAAVNPVRYFMDILRGVFLKGIGLDVLWPQYLTLAAMATATLWLATRQFRRAIV